MGSMDSGALAAAIITNGAVAIVIYLLFSWMRSLAPIRDHYISRLKSKKVKNRPPPLPEATGFSTSWLGAILKLDSDAVGDTAGADASVVIRTLDLGRQVFFWLSLISLAIVLPANLTGSEVDAVNSAIDVCLSGNKSGACGYKTINECQDWRADNPNETGFVASHCNCVDWVATFESNQGFDPFTPSYADLCAADPTCAECSEWVSFCNRCDELGENKLKDLDKATLANLGDGDDSMWAHVCFIYVATFVVIAILSRFNEDAVALRLRHQACQSPGGPSTSVIVSDIPGTTVGTLLEFAERRPYLFPKALLRAMQKAVSGGDAAVSGGSLMLTGASMGAGGKPPKGVQVPRATEDQGAPLVAQEGDGPAQPLTDDAASEERDNALPVPSRVGVIRNAWDEAVQMMAGRSHEEMVRWVVESVYGKDAVLEVLLVRDASKLQTIYAEIQKLTELSELTADIYSHQIATRADAPIEKKAAVKRRLKGIPTLFNEWGKAYRASLPGSPKKVDVLQLCAARLTHLKEELAREKEAMAVAETPTAIVVFKDRQTASVASQVMLHHDRRFWTVSPAPQPDEIIWPNMTKRNWNTSLRRGLITVAFYALLIFYLVPVTFVQAFLDTDRWVREEYAVLKNIRDYPALESLVQGFLPGLAMLIFLAILPPLLKWWEKLGGARSVGEVEVAAVHKLYKFQFVAVFLMNLGVAALSKDFETIVDEPSTFLTKLAQNVPGAFAFFTSFLLVRALIESSVLLLDAPGAILFWLFGKLAPTPRTRERLLDKTFYDYSARMPVHSTTFLICVVFSFITPILPIVGLVYFTMARNYAAYNLTYMSTPQFNAGGLMWTNIHAHVMAALVTLQLIATFSFGLKEAPGPSALSFVLVLPTVLYWKSSTARLEEPIKKLPLKGAQEIDALQEREGVTKPAQGLYLHPGMAVTDETIDATVRECERMLGVVGRYEDGPEGRMAAKGMVEEGRGVERMEA